MAFPVVQEAIESSTNTAGTSHVVTLPTATAGQLLLIILDKGSTAATINAHASLTELLDENSANGLYIAYRWMDGTEPASYTLTSSASTRSARIAYRISGVLNPSAQPPVIGTTGTGTSATPDPPSSAAPSGTKDYLFIAFYGAAGEEADDDTWSDTPPTSYTPSPPRQKACGTAGTNLGGMIAAAERALNTGSAQNPGTFAKDVSAAWRSQTILVYPAEPVTVTPDVLALAIATFAPTVTAIANQLVTPTTLALITARFAPTVTIGTIITPGPLALVTAGFAPTVTASAGTVVTPPTLALLTTLFAPTVTATDHKLIIPGPLALVTASFAPTVTATDHQLVTPSTLALVLTTYAPSIFIPAPQLVTPLPAALALTAFAPTILIQSAGSRAVPVSQHGVFLLPRLRQPKPSSVTARGLTRQAMAQCSGTVTVRDRVMGVGFTVAPRQSTQAVASLRFIGRATAWSRRPFCAGALHCDLKGWTARRKQEDDELLLLLRILEDHESAAR